MKKVLIALLAASMLFAFTACDDDSVSFSEVGTAEALAEALANGEKNIALTDDISDLSEAIVIGDGVTIDGNGKTITSTFAATGNTSPFTVNGNGVRIYDATFKVDSDEASYKDVPFAMLINEAENVALDNVTFAGKNSGLNVHTATNVRLDNITFAADSMRGFINIASSEVTVGTVNLPADTGTAWATVQVNGYGGRPEFTPSDVTFTDPDIIGIHVEVVAGTSDEAKQLITDGTEPCEDGQTQISGITFTSETVDVDSDGAGWVYPKTSADQQ